MRAHNQNTYTRGDGTAVLGSYHKAHCQKNPAAYAVWNTRLKSGFPSKWENKKEKPKSWTEEEKERVLEALSTLPNELLLDSVEGIYRLAAFNG